MGNAKAQKVTAAFYKLVLISMQRRVTLGNTSLLNKHCLDNVYAFVFLSDSHVTALALGFVLCKKKEMGEGQSVAEWGSS